MLSLIGATIGVAILGVLLGLPLARWMSQRRAIVASSLMSGGLAAIIYQLAEPASLVVAVALYLPAALIVTAARLTIASRRAASQHC